MRMICPACNGKMRALNRYNVSHTPGQSHLSKSDLYCPNCAAKGQVVMHVTITQTNTITASAIHLATPHTTAA